MFLLTYVKASRTDGTGDLSQKYKEYEDIDELKRYIENNLDGRAQFTNIRIFAPLGHENLDYKEKFEELYNHVLMNAGIRKEEPAKKGETIVK